MAEQKYRLVTRSDLRRPRLCRASERTGPHRRHQVRHPKDRQDGTVVVSDRDITTNLPYVHGVHLAFDHHLSETIRLDTKPANHVIDPDAPSAARVVFNHYGGRKVFAEVPDDLLAAVDKGDAAQFAEDEILEPGGWGAVEPSHGCADRSRTFP